MTTTNVAAATETVAATASKGFTIATLANRAKDIESKAWLTYSAICALARVRGTTSSIMQTRIFGEGKVSATFRKAWALGGKLYSNGMTETEKSDVTTMGIDEALALVEKAMARHMTALGVTTRDDYDSAAEYSSKEARDAAIATAQAEKEAEEKAKAEADAAKEAEAAKIAAQGEQSDATDNGATDETPAVMSDPVSDAMALVANMSNDELLATISRMVSEAESRDLLSDLSAIAATIRTIEPAAETAKPAKLAKGKTVKSLAEIADAA